MTTQTTDRPEPRALAARRANALKAYQDAKANERYAMDETNRTEARVKEAQQKADEAIANWAAANRNALEKGKEYREAMDAIDRDEIERRQDAEAQAERKERAWAELAQLGRENGMTEQEITELMDRARGPKTTE